MRSARMLLATSAASTVLFLAAPGAYAAEWDHHQGSSYGKEDSSHGKEDSSYGKEHGKEDSSHGKEHDKAYGKEHDKYGKEHGKEHGKHESPRGGMHAGGGALTMVNDTGWGAPRDTKPTEPSKGHEQGSESWKGEHHKPWKGEGEYHKPRGGMHAGGGALSTPAVTAGGLGVLAVAATGLYAMRRTRTASSVA